MKIIRDHDPEGVLLSEIPCGELFIYDGAYYMKAALTASLDAQFDIDPRTYDERTFAINLETGTICMVPLVKVPPVHARIRISGRAD